MAVRGAGNTVVTYNSQNITAYLNSAELAATGDELESTNLASTVMEYSPSLANYTLTLEGDWSKALDDILGVDALAPVTRTCSIKITDETGAFVQYTWTKAFITGYSITAGATEKVSHSPSLRLSGTPTRTTG
jgi:hypothetical protein